GQFLGGIGRVHIDDIDGYPFLGQNDAHTMTVVVISGGKKGHGRPLGNNAHRRILRLGSRQKKRATRSRPPIIHYPRSGNRTSGSCVKFGDSSSQSQASWQGGKTQE